MRVTDKLIFEGASKRSGKARDDVEAASREASTGVRVQHPWDDPGAASTVVGLRASANRMQAIGDIAERATGELNAADEALSGMDNVLNRAHELAVQFSNDTYSPQERAAAAHELDGLLAQTREFANARFGGRYLFAGFKDNAAPFDATGVYSGDSGVRQAEVAPGQFEAASVPGDQVFKGAGGGIDLFASLQSLKTALAGNDSGAIRASVGTLDSGIDQVVQSRARIGTAVNVFDTARSAALVAVQSDNTAASKRTDADVVASATKLAFAQRALDAALTASAKSFQLTLLDKLR